MSAGGKTMADIITADEGSEQPSTAAQAGSVQPLPAEAVAGATETLAASAAATAAGDHGSSHAGTVVTAQDTEHSQQAGSDVGDGIAVHEAGVAVVAAVAYGPSAGSAKQGTVAALVQGGPEAETGRISAGQGSVAEILTPERNAALLKVQPHASAHAPQAQCGPMTSLRSRVAGPG